MGVFKGIKKTIKKVGAFLIALPIIIKVIAVVMLVTTLTTFIADLYEMITAKNTPAKIYEELGIEEEQDISELIQIKGNSQTGYYLDFVDDIDAKLEALIETLNTNGAYHNVPDDTEFLKKLLQAEVVTKFPNLGGEIPEGKSGFQGAIDIKRATPNKEVGEMKNTGQGETTLIETESSYSDISLTPKEEEIQSWTEGKSLILYNDAYVYDEDANIWTKREEDSKYVIIDRDDEVIYTGNYEKVEDKLNNTVVFYIEVKSGDITGHIQSKDIDINSSNNTGEESETSDEVASRTTTQVTSRDPTTSREKETVGEEGLTYTVAIAAGHNNSDNLGARSQDEDLIEEDLTIQVAELVEELINEQYENVTVVQTGSTSDNPGGIKVEDRTKLARDANPDLCIQIHFNASDSAEANGVEVIYKEGDGYSQQLAEILTDSISSAMGLNNRGAGTDMEKSSKSLGIIENYASSGFPSVVTEGGFLTGNVDAEVIRDDGVEKYAQGIVDGIKTYLESDHSGLTATESGTTEITTSIESRIVNMKYVTPEELEDLKTSGDVKEATKYFTLNDDNKLVTLTWVQNADGNVEIKENAAMDFRTALQDYHMPFEYLLYYYIDTGYRDFSEKLADIVMDSEIVIALQDNITTTQTIQDTEVKIEADSNEAAEASDLDHDWEADSSLHSETITEVCTTKIDITYIETWCVKTYKDNSFSNKVLNMGDQDEIIVNVPGQVSYIEGENIVGVEQVVSTSFINSGLTDDDGTAIIFRFSESHRDVTTTNRMTNTYEINGDTKVEGITNKYVDLYIEENMNQRMQEGWFFKIVKNNEQTANLLDLTKYLMFLASNTNYGVTEFDFDAIFNVSYISISGFYGGTIQEKVWWAVIDGGYSKEAAAGVLGNIEAESGFNPDLIEKGNGIGFGLCQWSFGRREQLEAYAASKGVDPSDINTQIEFLIGEITPGGGADGYASYQLLTYNGYSSDDWENATTPEDAAIAFCWSFERPGVPRMDVRTEAARKYYEQFKDLEHPTGDSRIGQINLSPENANTMMQMLTEAIRIAEDDRYTYSQENRMGEFQYDCSSFVSRLYKQYFNVNTPSTTSGYGTNYYVGDDGAVELQPGDVLWRSGHVEIYLGNGLRVRSSFSTIPYGRSN